MQSVFLYHVHGSPEIWNKHCWNEHSSDRQRMRGHRPVKRWKQLSVTNFTVTLLCVHHAHLWQLWMMYVFPELCNQNLNLHNAKIEKEPADRFFKIGITHGILATWQTLRWSLKLLELKEVLHCRCVLWVYTHSGIHRYADKEEKKCLPDKIIRMYRMSEQEIKWEGI